MNSKSKEQKRTTFLLSLLLFSSLFSPFPFKMAPRKRKHEDTLSPSQPKLSFGSRPIQQEQVKEHSENILAVEVPANPTNDSPPLDQTPLIPVKSEQQPEKSNKSGGEEIPKQAAIKAEVKEAIAPKPMKRTASFTPRPKMPEKDRIRTELAKVADLQRPLEEGEETNPEGLGKHFLLSPGRGES